MTDIDRAAEIIALATRGALTADGHPMKMSDLTAQVIAESLADAGLLAPDPQIIRTLDEIDALDPETVLLEVGNVPQSEAWTWIEPETGKVDPTLGGDLPVVVVATGAQVRAARTALQEATE